MKINMLLMLATTVGTLGIVAAKQTKTTSGDHLMPHQPKNGQVDVAPISKGLTGNGSGATWGLHEPFKDCVPCHGDQSEKATPDKPHLVSSVPKLCYECHKDYISLAGWVHGPVSIGECLFCHEPHNTDKKSLLKKPVPELCYQCHEAGMLESVANHSDESYANCNNCHDGHTSPGRMLLKQDFIKTDAGLDYISKNPSARPQSTFVDRRGSLSGLRGVSVVAIVEKSDLFKRYGLTEDNVKKKFEMQLRRNGIRIIGREERILRQSWLYVHLRLMEVPSQNHLKRVNALSGSINIFLRQKVELLGTPGESKRRFCTATTWDTSGIVIWGTTQVEEGLDETIEILAKKFSEDYRSANPKSQASEPVRGKK
ncbi:MAG: cytochrome c3 family protein [Planctomycetota bacterium]|jgi:predicted CXXCH cytochrome family protein